MFKFILSFLKELHTRTLFDRDIKWNVTKTEKGNVMFYTINANFLNEKCNKTFSVTMSTENNILFIDADNGFHKKYYLDDDELISARDKLVTCILYNLPSEEDKLDNCVLNTILRSKSY